MATSEGYSPVMTIQPQGVAPAGWYPSQAPGVEQWWDGTRWTEQRRATPAQVAYPAAMPHRMVTKAPKKTSHTFHLIMTIITGGIWGVVVWLPLTALHKFQHEKTVTKIR